MEAGTQGAAEATEKGLPRQKAKGHLPQGSRPGLPLGSPEAGSSSTCRGRPETGSSAPLPLVPGAEAGALKKSRASALQFLLGWDATGVKSQRRKKGLRVLAQLCINSGEQGEEPAGGYLREGSLFISQISPH